jgi:hypothetical protein
MVVLLKLSAISVQQSAGTENSGSSLTLIAFFLHNVAANRIGQEKLSVISSQATADNRQLFLADSSFWLTADSSYRP